MSALPKHVTPWCGLRLKPRQEDVSEVGSYEWHDENCSEFDKRQVQRGLVVCSNCGCEWSED